MTSSSGVFLPSSLSTLTNEQVQELRQRFGSTHGASFSAGWWVCVAIATALLVMRLFNRVLYSGSERQRLRADDWLITASWLALVGVVSCAEVMRSLFGLGSGLEEVLLSGVEGMLKLNLIATVLGYASIALTKLSLAALYFMWVMGGDGKKITTMPQRSMKVSLGIFTVILLAAGIAFPVTHVLACGEVKLHWTVGAFDKYEKCIEKQTLVGDAHFAYDMFSDAVFVLLAGPIRYSVGASKREFFAIVGALTFAACAVIAASMRMTISHGINGIPCVLTWLIAEASLLLVLASGLSLHTLVARVCRSKPPPHPQGPNRGSAVSGGGRWSTTFANGVPQYSLGGSSGSGSSKAMAHASWSKSSFKGSGVFGSIGRPSVDVAVGSGSLYDGIGGGRSFGGIPLPGSRGNASTNPGEDFEIKPVEKLRIIRQDGKLMVERVVDQGSSAHGTGARGQLWGDEEASSPAEATPYDRLEFMFDTKG